MRLASAACRAVRCSTWAGRWAYKQWTRNYLVPIEDPFDATDNCARSIFAVNVGYVRDAFQESLAVLQHLPDSNSEPLGCPHLMTR